MSNERITDRSGRLTGTISENSNELRVYNARGVYIGHYSKSSRATYNSRGIQVYSGNQIMRLFG